MTFWQAARQGLWFYRRTYGAVALGVATAVAVLAGAWLVGHSVTDSLARLVERRLGRTSLVVAAETPFTDAFAGRLNATPLFALDGVIEHQSSSRRAGPVAVYGVDDRFFAFHGVETPAPQNADVLLSPDLAAELAAAPGDALLVRVVRPTDIPIDTLHGRKEDVGRTMRLQFRDVLAADAMGEFSLIARQGPVRAVFVPLARLQRDLGLADRVNAALLSEAAGPAAALQTRLRAAVQAADLGLEFSILPETRAVLVESSAGLVPDAAAGAVRDAARDADLPATPVLTWLANTIRTSARAIPYSLIAAVDASAAAVPTLAPLTAAPDGEPPPIVLNDWAARELGARVGDSIDIDYYRWADEGRLTTDRATFRLAGVTPMTGLTADPRLAPDYPGITESRRVTDWDPPFPIDLRLVRPQDEAYWDAHRTTPKAFIPLEVGQRLWQTRYGRLTSVRVGPIAAGRDLEATRAALQTAVVPRLDPAALGLTVVDIRAQQTSASAGATDFGAYFSYFSFFLVVSALLLAALFFRLSIEQRLPQIGVLRAIGFSLADVRRLFLLEGAAVALAGTVVGIALAIGWAALMMYGLRTWWVGAVGTTELRLSVDAVSLLIGAAGGALAAITAIAITVRGLHRRSPRALLAGASDASTSRHARHAGWIAMVCLALAVAITALALLGWIPAAAGFFGAGGLALIAGLALLRGWLGQRGGRGLWSSSASRGTLARLWRLGARNASWRPGRSLTSAALVAAAVFLLVSVESFRKSPPDPRDPRGGTGGFALIGEAALPIVHDPSSPEGRDALGLATGAAADSDLAGVQMVAMRLRPGDDASCLNLYQPKQPRVAGVPRALIDSGRFTFAAGDWSRLGPPDADGTVPAIVDQTSLQYVLHASVGDVIEIDRDTTRPHRLRIVGSLRDSVLQGEILVSEAAFLRMFPDAPGYRLLFVDVTDPAPPRLDAVARLLEDRLEPFGVDVQETARRLDAFHRVENTYLSTFQALGGLGLLLGVVGLAAVIARNVLERRRELALLGAAGYTSADLRTVVAAEQIGLLAVGLVIGLAAALLAIAPVLIDRGGRLPALSFTWLLLVAVAGVASTLWATRLVRRMPIVSSLRSE